MAGIFRNQTTNRNPSIICHVWENRINLRAADIIKVNINATFNLCQTLLNIFRFIINGSNAKFFFQESTFICTTCRTVNITSKISGNLTGHHAGGATCGRYQHIFTSFGFASFCNAPHAGPACKTKYAEMLTNIVDRFI